MGDVWTVTAPQKQRDSSDSDLILSQNKQTGEKWNEKKKIWIELYLFHQTKV